MSEYSDLLRFGLRTTNIVIKEGEVVEAKSGWREKFIARGFHKGAWATVVGEEPTILKAAETAAERLSKHAKKVPLGNGRTGGSGTTRVKVKPENVSLETKTKRLLEIADWAGDVKATVNYGDAVLETDIESSEGKRAKQRVVRCGLHMVAVATAGGQMQQWVKTHRGTGGWEIVEKINEEWARECGEKARALLRARAAPSGKFTVVLDPALVGVLCHESIGHMSEGDAIANRNSVARGRLGRKIASPLVTIVDDATHKGAYGTYFIDRDGVKTQRTTIIRNGVLKSHLNNRASGGKLSMKSTGNCREEQDQVRMTNTFMLPGRTPREEIIKSVKDGIYLIGTRGGTADPLTGYFNFAAQEGYKIENGRLTQHLKNVAVLGNTLETLKSIEAVGKDFEVKSGHCGKGTEWVPVGDGGPTIRTIATVGGTDA